MRIPSRTAALLAAGLVLAGCQDDSSGETGGTNEDTNSAETSSAETGAAQSDGTATSSSDAEETATSDMGAASNEATDAAADAAQSGESPTVAAEDEAESAADAEGVASAESEGGSLDALLTRESWDSARVVAAIRAADLPEERKTALLNRVKGSDSNTVSDAAIEEVRSALGVD